MNRKTSYAYGKVHRCLLQIITARTVISKKELTEEILPSLNNEYSTSFNLESVIGDINSAIRDIGFSIKDMNCDNGETYYSFINTTNDAISHSCCLSPKHLSIVEFIVTHVIETENVKYVDVLSDIRDSFKGGKDTMSITSELFDNHWFYRYKCRNTETIIGGPRLILEMGHWLTNSMHVGECPVCMDPVVGGLHCPHGCGACLHRACAYRSLCSMQSNDDNTDKGVCPNCHCQWVVDLSNFSENGRIYKQ